MPYIKQHKRSNLDRGIDSNMPQDAGELNYCITSLCVDYLTWCVKADYAGFNEVIGVLECAKQELYRRMLAPYEDRKKDENGDVF